MIKSAIVPVFFIALTACTVAPDRVQPIVSEFNGDSVNIQLDGNLFDLVSKSAQGRVQAAADAKAREICLRGQRKRAEFTSVRRVVTGQYAYVYDRLYLCLN